MKDRPFQTGVAALCRCYEHLYRTWVVPMNAKGLTLIELLVVVTVVGVMALIAVPSYQSSVQKSNRADAMRTLMDLALRQERFFADNKTYTDNLSDLGAITTTVGEHYIISADSLGNLANSFVLTATAIAGDAQYKDTRCRTWSLDHRGQKSAQDANANSTTDTCWVK